MQRAVLSRLPPAKLAVADGRLVVVALSQLGRIALVHGHLPRWQRHADMPIIARSAQCRTWSSGFVRTSASILFVLHFTSALLALRIKSSCIAPRLSRWCFTK